MIELVKQEPDRVPGTRLFGIAVLSIGVGALGVFGAALMLQHSRLNAPGVQAVRTQTRPLLSLERTQIEHTERGLALRAEQRKRLGEYGWVNRAAGIAHIPIERAIDLSAEGAH